MAHYPINSKLSIEVYIFIFILLVAVGWEKSPPIISIRTDLQQSPSHSTCCRPIHWYDQSIDPLIDGLLCIIVPCVLWVDCCLFFIAARLCTLCEDIHCWNIHFRAHLLARQEATFRSRPTQLSSSATATLIAQSGWFPDSVTEADAHWCYLTRHGQSFRFPSSKRKKERAVRTRMTKTNDN